MKATVREEILEDVLNRSRSAAVSFSAMALLIMYTGFFAENYITEVRILCAGIILLNMIRLYITIKSRNAPNGLAPLWPLFLTVTGLNGLLWGIVLSIGMIEASAPTWSVLLTMVIFPSYCFASILTLGSVFKLQAAFVWGMSLPFAATALKRYYQTGEPFFIVVVVIALISSTYALIQGTAHRKRFREKWSTASALLKSQQELIEQRAMTEHVNRLSSIGEMAAGFAHEINNPLAIVIGNLEILEAELSDKKLLDPQTNKIIQKAINSSVRISKIIKGLRTLSRASSKEGKGFYSLPSILEDSLVLFEQRMSTTQTAFKLDDKTKSNFYCDPVQIGQVMVNVLNNACDVVEALPENETRWVTVTAYEKNDCIFIEVSNSGPAIKDDVRKKIFTPFFTTKPVGQGMGLGLVISRSIALQHGGNLEAKNDTGVTTFVLSVPLMPDDSQQNA